MPLQPIYKQWDEALSDAERDLVSSVSNFAETVVAPFAQQCDEYPSAMSRPIVAHWAKMGMMGLQSPASLGGLDGSYFAKIRAAQELARWSFASAFSLINMQGVTTRIAQYANRQQQERYLPAMLKGDCIGAFALTEPGAGSDLSAISTTAKKVDGGWVINGEKSWITNCAILDVVLVLAQCSTGMKGLGGFLINLSDSGVERLPTHPVSVGFALGAGGIRFKDCFVPDENMIHAPGEAYKVALTGINAARIHVAAMCTSMLEASLAQTIDYCSDRQAFGLPLTGHQGLRWQLVDAANNLEASNQLVFRGAQLVSEGKDATLIAAHSKRFSVRAAQMGIDICMQSMGARGILNTGVVSRHRREIPLAGFADGTTEMQNERIGSLLPACYGTQK